jgi:regulator of telomere elongation helicase 1
LKKDQPYNFILTSGTLSPLNLWECELGLKFPAPLALPNIIQDDQLIAYTINKGVNGSFFDFNYSQRNNEFMFKDLAFTILAMIKTLPNGVVILFSSYSLLDNFRKNAGASTMSNLWREKDLFFENKDSTNFKKDLEQYI